jgi:SAM-dependent methyltransferase
MSLRLLLRLRVIMRRHFGVLPLTQSIPELADWFETPLGQALLSEQKEALESSLSCLFGYHLLQLSVSPRLDLTGGSRISHRFALNPESLDGARVAGVADFNHLPLPAETIDLVLIHHALDFSQSPHQLLRESVRVLIPRGYVIIVGFNPWSWFGVGRWFGRLFGCKAHWRHQSLRLGRLLDWLTLLDLEPVTVQRGFYRPPLQRPGLLKYLHWLERWGKRLRLPWGGFYLVVARKDIVAMTPLRPAWSDYKVAPGLGVTKIRGRVSRSRSHRLCWREQAPEHH